MMVRMTKAHQKHLFLPARDRSFWKCEGSPDFPLLYLAWGRRDFHDQRIPVCEHEGWVCVCIQEGSPTILIRKRRVPLTPGQIVFIREDCPFGWDHGAGHRCRLLLWMWRRPLLPGLAAQPSDSSAIYRIPVAQRPVWSQLHGLCRDEILMGDGLSPVWLESCQRQIEVLLLRLMEGPADVRPAARRVALALDWMQKHVESREPVSRLCDFLEVSQPTLNRLFRRETGESAAVHFHRIKMEHAKQLLQAGAPVVVKEIAYRHHFGHAPTHGH
jgi:AraC family transcriptional regulator of arabinose operon